MNLVVRGRISALAVLLLLMSRPFDGAARAETPSEKYRTACGVPLTAKLPSARGSTAPGIGGVDNGWEVVEKFGAAPKCLASAPDKNAVLWKYETPAGAVCYYLYRYNATEDDTLNGILCFLPGCEICAYDVAGPSPDEWSEFALPGAIEKCSDCHTAGYNAPREISYGVAEREDWMPKWQACADLADGPSKGPKWKMPTGASQWKSTTGACNNVPTSCRQCHGDPWPKPASGFYCSTVFTPAFDIANRGSMAVIGEDGQWDKVPKAECEPFLNCINCNSAENRAAICKPTKTLTVTKTGSGTGTVTSAPAGINCGNDCTDPFDQDSDVELTATAAFGSNFGGWSGACSGSGATCTVKMSADKSAIARFNTGTNRTLYVTKTGAGTGTVTSAPAGINCGATCFKDYADKTEVTLTPTVATGSIFTGWSGACNGAGACVVTMNATKTVTATFAIARTLTVSKAGTGGGTVMSNPAGINCGADCTNDYANGTVVTLTATANSTSTFAGWSGGGCTGTAPCAVTMDAAKNVTATFNTITRSLTVSKAGGGTGTVTSNPAGINCGTDCTQNYTNGTSVTLTAVAATGSLFTGWSGACSGTGTCTLTMSAAKNVTATFVLARALTVTKNGTGSGTVTSTPAGINCGADCTESYANATSVTLTPTAATGSTFAGWGGACTGVGACTVAMTAAKTVTATFTAAVRTLTVSKAGSGGGTVTSSPAGINCGTDCSETYTTNAMVTLTATAVAGSTFAGWSGACTGNGSCTVMMSSSQTVTAMFQLPVAQMLTVMKSGSGSGTVTSMPAGINCGATCSAGYPASTMVTLTASPAMGSTFAGWGGACSGTGGCTVMMSSGQTVTAMFQLPAAQTLMVMRSGNGTVTSSPAGINCGTTCSASYAANTMVTLTATPGMGATFGGWSGACSGMGACTVSMSAMQSVNATFVQPSSSP